MNASEALLELAAGVIPGGVNTCRRRSEPRVCFRRGAGAYLEDLDGRRYLDYHAAYGAILLGHAHPGVASAVTHGLADGVLFGVGVTEAEVALAGKLAEHVPSIEQSVERVTHALAPEDYVAVGRDIESRTMARAVKWHCEHRILLNDKKTVIFP